MALSGEVISRRGPQLRRAVSPAASCVDWGRGEGAGGATVRAAPTGRERGRAYLPVGSSGCLHVMDAAAIGGEDTVRPSARQVAGPGAAEPVVTNLASLGL
jgi:hypothetical protein